MDKMVRYHKPNLSQKSQSLRFRNLTTDSKFRPLTNFPIVLFSRVFLFNNHGAWLPTRFVVLNERKPENELLPSFVQPNC